MKINKVWLVSALSLAMAQVAHAILVPPQTSTISNCGIGQPITSVPAILNEKAQLQSQLCVLQNMAKSQQQSIQTMQQSLSNTQSQIQVLQKNIAAVPEAPTSFKWVKVSAGHLPRHAFVAAQNAGGNVYICQANYTMPDNPNTYLYPGMLTDQGCVITFGGKSYVENSYKILVSKDSGFWAASNLVGDAPSTTSFPAVILSENAASNQNAEPAASNQNVQPIIGGYEPYHYIYVCKANVNNAYYIGKVVSGNCNVALKGKEASWPDYQVLLSNEPGTDSNS